MPPVLALLLTAAAAATYDPPFVIAAKERQAKARAFEVTLTVRKEWIGVQSIGTKERRDFEGIGTAKLAVDGERFWYQEDVPQLTGMRDRIIRRRCEAAFDGRWHFMRIQTEFVNGERARQLSHLNAIQETAHPDWGDTLELVRWVFRGMSPGTPFGPVSSDPKPSSFWPTHLEQLDRVEVIDGRKCVEVVKVTHGLHGESRPTIWLDAADYLPVRAEGTTIHYRPHPVLGRVPSGWIKEPTDPRFANPTMTVTVDSFELRDSIPGERFVIRYPAGSKVVRSWKNVTEKLIATEDGSLVPDLGDDPKPPTPPAPEPPTRSLQHSLWVVGGVVTVFVFLVVLLRRLARNRTDDSPDSGESPRLLT